MAAPKKAAAPVSGVRRYGKDTEIMSFRIRRKVAARLRTKVPDGQRSAFVEGTLARALGAPDAEADPDVLDD